MLTRIAWEIDRPLSGPIKMSLTHVIDPLRQGRLLCGRLLPRKRKRPVENPRGIWKPEDCKQCARRLK